MERQYLSWLVVACLVSEHSMLPTKKGRFFCDELSVKFYPSSVRDRLDAENLKYGMFFKEDKYV